MMSDTSDTMKKREQLKAGDNRKKHTSKTFRERIPSRGRDPAEKPSKKGLRPI
jgi:hypothetical protein